MGNAENQNYYYITINDSFFKNSVANGGVIHNLQQTLIYIFLKKYLRILRKNELD